MAKQKGHRANKPQDGKGTVNDPNLYRNKYREDVYKDDEENVEVETKSDPVENTATQEIGESFVETKKDHDYKKRYDDLKNHYDKKLAEWKDERDTLQKSWKSVESAGSDIRIPRTKEEYEELQHSNPDLYNAIESLSTAKAEKSLSELKEQVEQHKSRETTLQREKAYVELLGLQPDFNTLKSENKFLKWLEEQPSSISNGIYKNSIDARWASRVVDLYKADTGKPSRSVPKQNDAAASVNAPQARDVKTTDGKGNRIWKASEIERMKPWEFEKVEAEIDKARSEGRIDLSS
jgi:anion-transporting  ArsA/GET3 family ATPase